MCRFLSCLICQCTSKDVKPLRNLWVYPNICEFSELFVVCVPECVSLICLCILSVEGLWFVYSFLPRISSDMFLGVCLRICNLIVGAVPNVMSPVCLSLYVPRCKVCEWLVDGFAGFYVCDLFEGVYSRLWGFCSVSVYISQHVRSVNILSLYEYVPGCSISGLFMCIVKHLRSLICFLLFVPGCEIPNCLWVYVPGCVVSDLFVGVYPGALGLQSFYGCTSQDFEVYFLECAFLWSSFMYVTGWAVSDPFAGLHPMEYALWCLWVCLRIWRGLCCNCGFMC